MNTAIGNVLARLRLAAGLSQELLAYEAGIHRTYVSQLERGLKSPTIAVLFKIAPALQMTPSQVLRSIEKEFDAIQNS